MSCTNYVLPSVAAQTKLGTHAVKRIIAEDLFQKQLLYKTYDIWKATLFFQLNQLIKSNDPTTIFKLPKRLFPTATFLIRITFRIKYD